MRKLVRSRSKKSGLAPGTPVFTGDTRDEFVHITIIDYTEGAFSEKGADVSQCLSFRDTQSVTWINVSSLHEVEVIQKLAEGFNLHPLVLEDILSVDQRPKLEDYGEYLFAVLKMLRWDEKKDEILSEQVSLVLGPNYLISFQEKLGDVFDPIRDRIRSGKGRVRKMKTDYLAYCLMDAIVDGYFTVLEYLGDRIESVESTLIENPTPDKLRYIHRLKREGLYLRKCVWPLREVVNGIERNESPLVSQAVRVYFRDVYDHTIQVLDTMETMRDVISGMLDTYLSSLSNRMNEVMKVLTIIATIFIPLTFIAGIYGMNFHDMPELGWRWGYPGALAVMAVVAGGMLLHFRKKKWL